MISCVFVLFVWSLCLVRVGGTNEIITLKCETSAGFTPCTFSPFHGYRGVNKSCWVCCRCRHNPTHLPPPSFMASAVDRALANALERGCCCSYDPKTVGVYPRSGTWGSLRWHMSMAAQYLEMCDKLNLVKCLRHVLVACVAPGGVLPSSEEIPETLPREEHLDAFHKFQTEVLSTVAEAFAVWREANVKFFLSAGAGAGAGAGALWGRASVGMSKKVRKHMGLSLVKLFSLETHVGVMVEASHLCPVPVVRSETVLKLLRHLTDKPSGRQLCVDVASVFAAVDLIRRWPPKPCHPCARSELCVRTPKRGTVIHSRHLHVTCRSSRDLQRVVICLVWLAHCEQADRAADHVPDTVDLLASHILVEVCVAPITCAVTKMPQFTSPATWKLLTTHSLLDSLLHKDWFSGGEGNVARAECRTLIRQGLAEVRSLLEGEMEAGKGKGVMGCAVETVLQKLLDIACVSGL